MWSTQKSQSYWKHDSNSSIQRSFIYFSEISQPCWLATMWSSHSKPVMWSLVHEGTLPPQLWPICSAAGEAGGERELIPVLAQAHFSSKWHLDFRKSVWDEPSHLSVLLLHSAQQISDSYKLKVLMTWSYSSSSSEDPTVF